MNTFEEIDINMLKFGQKVVKKIGHFFFIFGPIVQKNDHIFSNWHHCAKYIIEIKKFKSDSLFINTVTIIEE